MKITKEIVVDVFRHAKKDVPIEACGYLGGKDDVVTKCFPMTNIDKSKEHFSFDPKEQFSVLKDARAKGFEMLAVYHSHPATPARPSKEDVRLAYDPTISYVIASLAGKQETIKSFKIKNGTVIPDPIEIVTRKRKAITGLYLLRRCDCPFDNTSS
jgi:proteasome lid subunit RPN8/RPN11